MEPSNDNAARWRPKETEDDVAVDCDRFGSSPIDRPAYDLQY